MLFFFPLLVLVLLTYYFCAKYCLNWVEPPTQDPVVPLSVNFHFTRVCNYQCGFCFHTQTTDAKLPLDDAKRGLSLLQKAGMKKLNFAGGEPFLYPKYLAELIVYCKEELKLESVSIVTNASKLRPSWFTKYGQYVDIVALSCDSFDAETNARIGRAPKTQTRSSSQHVANVEAAAKLIHRHKIKLKLNTVVNRYNWQEDVNKQVARIKPFRWKVMQVLPAVGENNEQIDRFSITREQMTAYVERHKKEHGHILVPEYNDDMRGSYLILDEQMRFIDNTQSETQQATTSPSILDVGVRSALAHSGFNESKFVKRKGVYDWCKQERKDLDW